MSERLTGTGQRAHWVQVDRDDGTTTWRRQTPGTREQESPRPRAPAKNPLFEGAPARTNVPPVVVARASGEYGSFARKNVEPDQSNTSTGSTHRRSLPVFENWYDLPPAQTSSGTSSPKVPTGQDVRPSFPPRDEPTGSTPAPEGEGGGRSVGETPPTSPNANASPTHFAAAAHLQNVTTDPAVRADILALCQDAIPAIVARHEAEGLFPPPGVNANPFEPAYYRNMTQPQGQRAYEILRQTVEQLAQQRGIGSSALNGFNNTNALTQEGQYVALREAQNRFAIEMTKALIAIMDEVGKMIAHAAKG